VSKVYKLMKVISERIRIFPKERMAYIPKTLISRGFVGDVQYLTAPSALVFALPGATFDELEESLKHVLNEISLMRGGK
jgi:hypothetical protein